MKHGTGGGQHEGEANMRGGTDEERPGEGELNKCIMHKVHISTMNVDKYQE